MKKINSQILLFVFLATAINFSCKKFLEVGAPKDAASITEIFSNDASATSALTGIYSRMTSIGNGLFSGGQNSATVLGGLSADELRSHSANLDAFYKNEIPETDYNNGLLWANTYAYIHTCNAILESLPLSNGVSQLTKARLEGEAKFIRSFCYFYLVNMFGDVPLNLTTDYRVTEIAKRTPSNLVYDQIVKDLKDAEALLDDAYLSSERVRPNKFAVKALLSRVYLYVGNWALAAQQSTDVIAQANLYELSQDLDKVFVKNSKEAIWQLMPTAGNNTNEGALFILTGTPTIVSLPSTFRASFDLNDQRRDKWTADFSNSTGTYTYPFKYKIKTTLNGVVGEYSMVLRLAEIYLIRAEANAKLLDPTKSMEDLNVIRNRAGLVTPLVGLNAAQCLEEVAKQRRFELFCEWGHRWFDIKRTGKSTEVLAPLKGNSWQSSDVLYPVPFDEISRNPNSTQNPGY